MGPVWGRPHGVPYTIKISGRDGAGANNTVTGWEVRLDPNFHHNDLGDLIDSGTGSASGRTVTIPGHMMTAGVRKLVVIGFANESSCNTPGAAGIKPQNGEVSAVFAIPIKVD